MNDVTLAGEVLLLSLEDEKGSRREQQRADCAIAGAVLVGLAMAERITVEDERVVVRDPSPLGDPAADTALARIGESGKARKAQHWVSTLRGEAVRLTQQELVEKGAVRHEKGKVLGLFPRHRYPEADGGAERRVRERLAAVVLKGAEPDPRTAALTAVLYGAGLHKLAFPGLGRAEEKEAKERMKAVSEGAWAAPAVRKAVEALQSAMLVVVIAATSSAAGTGEG